MHLKIKPENNSVKAYYENHTEFHEGDSGLDLFVPEEVKVPGKAIGFKINMMISCEAFGRDDREPVGLGNISYYLYPRSSMGAKTPLRLANSVGIIDAGYRGNIIAIVDNISEEEHTVLAGTRLVQICSPNLGPISISVVNQLSETTRGVGGLGSTGE
uniref:dUTP diphosphatase n=1 Tax=viral metagenome TaxID=1070528 RepID=A0A6C0L012_9ZZZZ|tara:strand:+ start:3343 stop:3816 length:474 start_codon:yes stop_codon:yes gene_type:complete